VAALGWGFLMDRWGRRPVLAAGGASGVLGAALATTAVAVGSMGAFVAGLVLMGFANSALQLGRFVAAEVHPPAEKGRAIARVVIGGTVGAVLGPLAAAPMGRWTQRAGLDELVGPYAASAVLFVGVSLVVFVWLRPEPRDLAAALDAQLDAVAPERGDSRPLGVLVREPAVRAAGLTMMTGQAVMVMLMVITSLHMKHHDHSLGGISFVISSHVVGMYAFSLFSGRLADCWGRPPVIVAGALTLTASCLAAAASPRLVPLAVSLFLLGLGWNFCYVGGSSLLADQLRPGERGRMQGVNDLCIGGVAAAASLGSGLVYAAVGYETMGLVGAVAAFVPAVLALRLRRMPSPEPAFDPTAAVR